MTTAQINKIKKKIVSTLNTHAHISPSRSRGLLKFKDMVGKLYEAEVLAKICEDLVTKEDLRIRLKGSGFLVLKQKGGPINRYYPYFEVYKDGSLFGEMFTDIYFKTLSSSLRIGGGLNFGDYHELDIALLQPNVVDKPECNQILIAIECKNTVIKKNIVRELLGFRRELSFLAEPTTTIFTAWPEIEVNARPSSVHMLYTNYNKNLHHYIDNCKVFGVTLTYHPM